MTNFFMSLALKTWGSYFLLTQNTKNKEREVC